MTAHKSFKRLVRARMAKTGESYTAARGMLLRAEPANGTDAPTLKTSDEKIRERTGHGWEEWFAILDDWGAAERPHRDIARWLAERLGIHPLAWNAQAITASYELTRGLREVGEKERRIRDHRVADGGGAGRAAVRGGGLRGCAEHLVTGWPAHRAHGHARPSRRASTGARARRGSTSRSCPRAMRRARWRSSTGDWPTPARRSG